MHKTHRIVALLLLPALFIGCAKLKAQQDFPFQDSGKREYRTSTLQADLNKHFGHQFPKIKVLLIETPTLEDASFIAQNEAFDSIRSDIEEIQVMFIVACPTEVYSSGYHTTKETARTLAKGRSMFRLTLMAADGQVSKATAAPLVGKELRAWIQE